MPLRDRSGLSWLFEVRWSFPHPFSSNVILSFTPFSLSSFSFPSLSFLLPFLSPLLVWVSLDAFVIAGVVAGNTFFSFPFFFFFLLFSPYPSLLSGP